MQMRSMRQALPLLIGLMLAVVVAVLARVFIAAGVPETRTVLVASAPLNPGESFDADRVQSITAHDSPFIRGVLREDELPRFQGGTVLMFIPAGAFVPRTAIAPPGHLTATARLSAVMVEGEQLLTLEDTDRIQSPPFSMLRPGDCLDLVAFFGAPAIGSSSEAAMTEPSESIVLRPEVTGTQIFSPTVSIPARPMAKWLARGVVRSVLGLPAPAGGEGATAVRAASASEGPPRLLLGVPQQALEGIVYAMGTAEQIHLVIAPPCARAEVPSSTGFAEMDLEQWVRVGRQAAGAPAFFLPSGARDSSPSP